MFYASGILAIYTNEICLLSGHKYILPQCIRPQKNFEQLNNSTQMQLDLNETILNAKINVRLLSSDSIVESTYV